MINSVEFSNRLEKVMDFYGETASSFSEKIGVQRSSISHILSGRNKPSLDFVLKILAAYPDVELYWLLNGKGNFPASTSPPPIEVKENLAPPSKETISPLQHGDKKIDKIMVFYTDGTFKEFLPA